MLFGNWSVRVYIAEKHIVFLINKIKLIFALGQRTACPSIQKI